MRFIYSNFIIILFFWVLVSSCTLENTCIFPKSSVAFLLLDEDELFDERNGFNRIKKFVEIHRNSYILYIQNKNNCDDTKIISNFSAIHLRLFPLKCYFNLVRSVKEATQMMIDIAKMHSGPIFECLHEKVTQTRETLESELTVKTVLKCLPLNVNEQSLVLDTCVTLNGIGSASENEFLNCGLDTETAQNLVQFFNNDTYLLLT